MYGSPVPRTLSSRKGSTGTDRFSQRGTDGCYEAFGDHRGRVRRRIFKSSQKSEIRRRTIPENGALVVEEKRPLVNNAGDRRVRYWRALAPIRFFTSKRIPRHDGTKLRC